MKPSQAIHNHRDMIKQVVFKHRATNPRVFGSVANGQANQTEARVRAILRQARMGDDAPGAAVRNVGVR